MTRNSYRRLKEDRISRLPDELLCYILSFLPVNVAVATCILSTRWRFVWTGLSKLCFGTSLYTVFKGGTGASRLENFISRVLLSGSGDVDEFYLYFHELKDLSLLKFWVSHAIMRNARQIKLDLSYAGLVEFPENLLSSKTLEVLKLRVKFFIPIPASGICFPSVKILDVQISNPHNSMTEKLFSICPVLEDLSIATTISRKNSMTNFNILSPTLKRLTFRIKTVYLRHKVIIKAPNLEHICIHDCSLIPYMLLELHSLREVHFSLHIVDEEIHADHALQLLECITKAKVMNLSGGTMQGLRSCADENLFPVFSNLTRLQVDIGESEGILLSTMLKCSPNLEVVGINIRYGQEVVWIEPQCVPHCLLSHVKRIKITGCDAEKELEMIKYLLKNSVILETITIELWRHRLCWINACQEKRHNYQKILMFERGSKTCQVEILDL